MIAVAIALDGQAAAVAFHDQIDSKRADAPLRSNAITGGAKALHNLAFESGLGALFLFVESAHEAAGILGMLDQLTAHGVGFEVVVGTEGRDNPHLVAGAAGADAEPRLAEFLVSKAPPALLSTATQR